MPLANASDGGGSIRVPASCCGLFGLKPTRGRTPLGPDAGEGWSGMSCVHAVSRSVRDSAALLDATCGADLGAPYAAQPPARAFLAEVGAPPGQLRIALQTRTWNGAETHPDCALAARDAAKLCESLGHVVEEAPFSIDADALRIATLTIISADIAAKLEDRAAALGHASAEGAVEKGTWLLSQLVKSRDPAAHLRAVRGIHRVGRELARFLLDYDVVLSPTMGLPPPALGVLSLSADDMQRQTATLMQAVGYTQLANAAGNPAMSVPLFWNGEGLPIGVQFMGRMNDEATLFRLAAQLEAIRPWFERRPGRAC